MLPSFDALTVIKDALYVAGMILLNEKALEVKEVGKRRCKYRYYLKNLVFEVVQFVLKEGSSFPLFF